MGRSKRRSEKEEFWRLVLHEYEASGLTIRAFCQREQLSEASFFAWRRIIEQRERQSGGAVDSASRVDATATSQSVKFVPVDLIDGQGVAREAVGSHLLEIVTPGGLTLRFSESLTIDRVHCLVSSLLQVEGESVTC